MLNELKEAWHALTNPLGQMIASTTTFTWGAVGYFNYAVWHDTLSLLGMAAAIFSCITLGFVNIARLIQMSRKDRHHDSDS